MASASSEVVLSILGDTTEFEISICRARFELANQEAIFWEKKLAAAIAKRG